MESKERRAVHIDIPEDMVEKLKTHIIEEDALFKSLRIAAAIFSTLLVVLTWIFVEKNNDIKAMQLILNQHSIQINETLVVVKSMLEADRRQQAGIDRNTGMVNDLNSRKK